VSSRQDLPGASGRLLLDPRSGLKVKKGKVNCEGLESISLLVEKVIGWTRDNERKRQEKIVSAPNTLDVHFSPQFQIRRTERGRSQGRKDKRKEGDAMVLSLRFPCSPSLLVRVSE